MATEALDHAAFPPQLRTVVLPEWARDLGVDGGLLVPAEAIREGESESWERTDWLGAAEWYGSCAAERAYERVNGPIHSYSFRLGAWDERMWQRCWANRIAMFLRRWASRYLGRSEVDLFGAPPKPEIVMTHDVDAVVKTIPLRVKQSAFHTFNALRSLRRGRIQDAQRKGTAALRFFLRSGNLWNFDAMKDLEERFGIRSQFNFYGGRTGWMRRPRRVLIDPGYDVNDAKLRAEIRRLHDGGWTIGLHQSFDAWRDEGIMSEERLTLERAAGTRVVSCRQHWLRFSFESTWLAQSRAGFVLDSTLGFNDRPGFRNGAALRIRPLMNAPSFEALPMVLMDSHLYDYHEMTNDERGGEIRKWVDEIRAVQGTATVLWHQQVIGDEYGWNDGFVQLLQSVTGEPDA